ncbi:MAG: hypothetical protein N2558_04640 [Patescibacteria group bacterium]|nr:hypothetical protein [Patescibacteria group bacterium]
MFQGFEGPKNPSDKNFFPESGKESRFLLDKNAGANTPSVMQNQETANK